MPTASIMGSMFVIRTWYFCLIQGANMQWWWKMVNTPASPRNFFHESSFKATERPGCSKVNAFPAR
eukprot:5597872-Heterocapsa_arctica.AAC.1